MLYSPPALVFFYCIISRTVIFRLQSSQLLSWQTLLVAYGVFMLVVRRRKQLIIAEPLADVGAVETMSFRGEPATPPDKTAQREKKKDKKAKAVAATSGATTAASPGGSSVSPRTPSVRLLVLVCGPPPGAKEGHSEYRCRDKLGYARIRGAGRALPRRVHNMAHRMRHAAPGRFAAG